MIKNVFEEQNKESRKGDFSDLVKEDLKDLKLCIDQKEIISYSKKAWNKMISERVEQVAFDLLLKENRTKSKTKHIQFEKFETRQYLLQNRNTKISKIIYSTRAGTLDIKSLNQWKYDDNLCVLCNIKEETMKHFMECQGYGRNTIEWEEIYENDEQLQFEIGKEVRERINIREKKIHEDGLTSPLAPTAPDSFCLLSLEE